MPTQNHNQSESVELDIAKLFFTDVEKIPAIIGRNDYLPLTRRIQRWVLLKEIAGSNNTETYTNLNNSLQEKLHELDVYLSGVITNSFNIEGLEIDFDRFLDDPKQKSPSLFNHLIENLKIADPDDKLRDIVWDYLYLKSLVPKEWQQYKTIPSTKDMEILSNHLSYVIEQGILSKKRLIEGCLRYVITISRLYIESGMPYLDLVQAGFTGLEHATERFDEKQGAHFQMYAGLWIRQRIERYIADFSRIIRVPVHRQEESKKIERVLILLRKRLNREPTNKELFLELDWISQDNLAWLEFRAKLQQYEKNIRKLRNRLTESPPATRKIPLKSRDLFEILCHLSEAERHSKPYSAEELDFFHSIGWIDVSIFDTLKKGLRTNTKKSIQQALKAFDSAADNMQFWGMINARHYSIEHEEVMLEPDGKIYSLRESLPANFDTEYLAAQRVIDDEIQKELKSILPDREYDIIVRRLGLYGTEETLEEIGQDFGVTRERIRQLESQALKRLKRSVYFYEASRLITSQRDKTTEFYEKNLESQILQGLIFGEDLSNFQNKKYAENRKREIESLIDKHIEGGRKRIWNTRAQRGRAEILKEALEEIGKPAHYGEIHVKAHELIPEALRFSKKRTYSTLFYHEYFTLLGGAVFGLSTWDNTTKNEAGEIVFPHCPEPLMPVNPTTMAFFESIMVAKDWLRKNVNAKANEFWLYMLEWAGQEENTNINKQAAFDAWYAAGLISYIDIQKDLQSVLSLTIPNELNLSETRRYCVNQICNRILKIPEMLLTIDRVAASSTPVIQKILFGGEKEGFDLIYRTNMLQSLSAIIINNNVWQLTQLGKSILSQNPPDELPDFDEVAELENEEEPDQLDWDEEVGFIEF